MRARDELSVSRGDGETRKLEIYMHSSVFGGPYNFIQRMNGKNNECFPKL